MLDCAWQKQSSKLDSTPLPNLRQGQIDSSSRLTSCQHGLRAKV